MVDAQSLIYKSIKLPDLFIDFLVDILKFDSELWITKFN